MAFLETKQDRVSFNCPRLNRIFEATVISTHAVTELEREQRQAGVPGVSDMLHMLRLEPHLQFLHHPTLNPPTHKWLATPHSKAALVCSYSTLTQSLMRVTCSGPGHPVTC